MNQPLNPTPSLLDMVFDGRNKKYGAYVIRLHYDRTLCRALLWMLASTTLLCLCFHLKQKEVTVVPPDTSQVDPTEFYNASVDLTPLPEAGSPKPKTSASPETPLQSTRIEDAAPAADQAEITADVQPLNVMPEGDPYAEAGEGNAAAAVSTIRPDSVFEIYNIDTYPEFEGGMSALRRFVATHARYPAEEAETGQEGIVLVRFVVDENGVVSRVSAQVSAGAAFDREAMKAVSLLPPFKTAGKAGGRSVKVAFTIPVKFRSR